MTLTVGSFEAKTHLAALLARVARGERITITRHGVPVALLVPVSAPNEEDRERAIEQLKQFGKGRTLGSISIRKLIEEGRRF